MSHHLRRSLGLLSLSATGICSMLGASVYIVPFMIQRNVEGIGPYVIPAFMFAAVPALLAAASYGALATAMPQAGGSYIYASRGLNPYLGFIASFSQWFGLSIAIGVIAYVIVPFFRDTAVAWQWPQIAQVLDYGSVRVSIALVLLWTFVLINIRGLSIYEKTLIPLMVIMFILGAVVMIVGFSHNQPEFLAAVGDAAHNAHDPHNNTSKQWAQPLSITTFLSAAAVLFASFIGFDSIAQAGSEAKNPHRNLPLAIGITIISVGGFYLLFTSAVYHTVPWYYVAAQAAGQDITAPGLLSPLLSPTLAALIILGAAIALLNDLPAMLLSVSRLMFAWAQDAIFPKKCAAVHQKYHTPHVALVFSGMAASLGILGSHFAGDFFLGVDIMVTSMLVNFLLMCLTLGMIHKVNPTISAEITFVKNLRMRRVISILGVIFLLLFLAIHLYKDLGSDMPWYFKSTPIWVLVMTAGSVIYLMAPKNKRGSSDINSTDQTPDQTPDQSTT